MPRRIACQGERHKCGSGGVGCVMRQLLFLVCVALQGASFEVASIAPCAPGTRLNPGLHNDSVRFVEPGGRFRANAVTVEYLIEWSYNIQSQQLVSTPAWAKQDCFDVVAKADGEVPEDQMKAMTRELLADRFKLRFHRASRELPAFIVSTGKTAPKLSPVKEGEVHGMSFERGPMNSYIVTATRYSLGQLNATLARALERVIVDQTGLAGEYDCTLTIVPDETQPNPMDATMILRAMKEDLGLAIEAKSASVEVMVIDGVDRPSAN
jgi:uncharacterized protein (TIGR03435 family)